MILSVINLKGGVGKSTLSQNLAVAMAHDGYKVCVVDTDFEQATTARWYEQRPDGVPKIPVFPVRENSLRGSLSEFGETYDIIIIDGTPQLGTLATRTLVESDLVLVPITPTGFDIWSFETFLERYNDAKARKGNLPAFVIFNRYRATNYHKGAIESIREFGLEVFNSHLGERMAFQEAGLQGLGVIEYKDTKAKEEMAAVYKELAEIVATM
jgi:chromosome partitioning protein